MLEIKKFPFLNQWHNFHS